MTRICHLFDASTGWEQRVGVCQLLDRLPSAEAPPEIALIDPVARTQLGFAAERAVTIARCRRWPIMAAPALARFLRQHGIDLVHAWGVDAAIAAAAGGCRRIVLGLFDPASARRRIKAIRTLAKRRGVVVVCAGETLRRRLVEGGVPPDRQVIIRPGVDFHAINQARRGPLRSMLGVPRHECLVVVTYPNGRDGGQFDAAWAVNLLDRLQCRFHLAVPGANREVQRIHRLDAALLGRPLLVEIPQHTPLEALIAVADVLIVAAQGDTSTTAVSWAMASETLVIGSAVHSVAELIGSGLNGLLFKRAVGKTSALPIAERLGQGESHAKLKETARGHAYEVFGLRRCVEQFQRLYDNLAGGLPAGEGIVDSALSG